MILKTSAFPFEVVFSRATLKVSNLSVSENGLLVVFWTVDNSAASLVEDVELQEKNRKIAIIDKK